MTQCIVATCNLDQWALDFDGNLQKVMTSIAEAKKKGATFRTGPELELSGYGCEDHFYEQDTVIHCWESLITILSSDLTDNILCDIGMPVIHQSVRYNARIWCVNRKIVCIRPKMYLADDGNYRESRWFTAWTRFHDIDEFALPLNVRVVTGQTFIPFGGVIIVCNDTSLASETCEELFTPASPAIRFGLAGAEIIANASGSHHNLRKLEIRMDLIRESSRKSGGCYLYSNQQGCDGGRLYFDGCSSIVVNGNLCAQGSQFSVYDVEVITAAVDLDDIRSYRAASASRSVQAAALPAVPRVKLDFRLTRDITIPISPPISLHVHTPEEEIALGPACWLWDYLRRSGSAGFFLPLSGGADSSATASIVGSMCQLVYQATVRGDKHVKQDLRRIIISGGSRTGTWQTSEYLPTSPQEIAKNIFYSCYMGTSNSSTETRDRARALSKDIGNTHVDVNIDGVVSAILSVFTTLTGKTPRYKTRGGAPHENLALQNIQARSRMIIAYLFAQLLPWSYGKNGYLLVLGSANVDEALRGYLTKYDCSSADINPIGGISKGDLKRFLQWAVTHLKYPSLQSVVDAVPTAELEPFDNDYKQADEVDMGMSYEELGIYGRLRKIYRCGPVSMFVKLCDMWKDKLNPKQIGEKVRTFFYYYSSNRHKLTTLTPSYHAENYSPEDNRYDLRQFLYNTAWTRQFRMIQQLIEKAPQHIGEREKAVADGVVNNKAQL